MENAGLSWNYLDILIAIPLLWGAYKGYTKGLIIEAASLAALVIGVYGAYRFSDLTSGFLQDKLDMQTEYLPLIAFAITFLGIVVLIHFFARMIDKLAKAVALGFLNRLLGSVFRIAKYAFIISILISILNKFDTEDKLISPELKTESILFPPIETFAPMIFPYLNLDELSKKSDQLEEEIREELPTV